MEIPELNVSTGNAPIDPVYFPIFSHILGIIIPIDYILFFRGVESTNQDPMKQILSKSSTGGCPSRRKHREVFGYPVDGPKDDDHGGWMPTDALATHKWNACFRCGEVGLSIDIWLIYG